MHSDLSSAFAFGAYLREHPEAAQAYDGLTQAQRGELLLRLGETGRDGAAELLRTLAAQ